jgi:hypothetical protein
MIEVNAIIKIERYDSISRNNHLKVISDYIPPQNYIWITVYRELVKCELDSRLISPIFAQVLTVEFIDRKRRKFVKRVVKMRRN